MLVLDVAELKVLELTVLVVSVRVVADRVVAVSVRVIILDVVPCVVVVVVTSRDASVLACRAVVLEFADLFSEDAVLATIVETFADAE